MFKSANFPTFLQKWMASFSSFVISGPKIFRTCPTTPTYPINRCNSGRKKRNRRRSTNTSAKGSMSLLKVPNANITVFVCGLVQYLCRHVCDVLFADLSNIHVDMIGVCGKWCNEALDKAISCNYWPVRLVCM